MGGTGLFTQRIKGKSKHVKAFQGAEARQLPGAASHEATQTLAAPHTLYPEDTGGIRGGKTFITV